MPNAPPKLGRMLWFLSKAQHLAVAVGQVGGPETPGFSFWSSHPSESLKLELLGWESPAGEYSPH